MNSNTRIAATQCSLGAWFVSGIYVQIPCIKEIQMMMMMIIIIIIIINKPHIIICDNKKRTCMLTFKNRASYI